jgi:zinc transporter ZupT
MGIQQKPTGFLNIALGVGLHKIPECLAMSFSLLELSKKKALIIMVIFSFSSPLGIAIGILLTDQNEIVQALFIGVSAGTFIYIAASEIIVEEFAVGQYKYRKYTALLLGIAFFSGLKITLDQSGVGE